MHILNLLSEHERFIQDDVQDLVSRDSKFSGIDAFVSLSLKYESQTSEHDFDLFTPQQTDFTTLLLRPLNRKLRQSTPQLLSLPPILAHTIYQALEFDQTLKDKWNYRPRVLKREGDGQTETWGEGEWEGLADVILGRKEWFDKWLGDEKTCEFSTLIHWSIPALKTSMSTRSSVVDDKYFEIIGSDDAWQINEDYAESGLRPTNSAMRTRDLFDQVTGRSANPLENSITEYSCSALFRPLPPAALSSAPTQVPYGDSATSPFRLPHQNLVFCRRF